MVNQNIDLHIKALDDYRDQYYKQLKKEARAKKRLRQFCLTILILGAFYIMLFSDWSMVAKTITTLILLIGSAFIFGIGYLILFTGDSADIYASKRKKYFKESLLVALINEFNPNMEYHPKKGLPANELKALGIFREGGIYDIKGEDYFYGYYKKNIIEFSEATVYTLYKTERDTLIQGDKIFQGLVFKARFNKRFNGITKILHRTSHLNTFKKPHKLHYDYYTDKELAYHPMENDIFNDLFSAYSEDELECRYILSFKFMEILNKLHEKFHQAKINLVFKEKHLFLLVDWPINMFEVPVISQKLSEKPELLDVYKQQLTMCTELVDELELNKNIWLS